MKWNAKTKNEGVIKNALELHLNKCLLKGNGQKLVLIRRKQKKKNDSI